MDLTLVGTLFSLLLCFLGLSWFAGTDAPYVPTKLGPLKDILKRAGVKKGKTFYELGSGDGRVVYLASSMGCKSIGIEQSLLRVLYSKLKAHQLGLKNTHFYHGNVFKRNYKDADVVYIYLLTKGVHRLESKLRKELKKGATVITQTYHFKSWKPKQKISNFLIYTK